jgi:hypothetical protein
MPYFSEYAEVEVDIKITPEEFVDHCSEKEIEKLIDELRSGGYLEEDEILSTHPIANEFYQNIDKIKRNRLVLTAEEDEILRKIASRF